MNHGFGEFVCLIGGVLVLNAHALYIRYRLFLEHIQQQCFAFRKDRHIRGARRRWPRVTLWRETKAVSLTTPFAPRTDHDLDRTQIGQITT